MKHARKSRTKGMINAALSSSSFGFAPFFSVSLMAAGLGGFEVLTYRWGTATLSLTLIGLLSGKDFRLTGQEFSRIFLLSLFRAATSASLIIAYSNIASGIASTIHFMYPIVVALCMMLFFGEPKSLSTIIAVTLSLVGGILLAGGDSVGIEDGNTTLGIICSIISVFSYAGYFILVRMTKAGDIEPVKLTSYVMGLGSIYFLIAGMFSGGVHIVTDPLLWMYIIGLGVVATMVSNLSLVKAIADIGPTLTSVFGAMEPLTAVVMGVVFFSEKLTPSGIAGIVLILITVTLVAVRQPRS